MTSEEVAAGQRRGPQVHDGTTRFGQAVLRHPTGQRETMLSRIRVGAKRARDRAQLGTNPHEVLGQRVVEFARDAVPFVEDDGKPSAQLTQPDPSPPGQRQEVAGAHRVHRPGPYVPAGFP